MKDIIKQELMKRLSKKDYCSFKIKECLIKKFGFKNKSIIEELIKEVIDKKYINDEEYKERYILHKLKTYHGLLYILYKLRELGYVIPNLDEYKELELKYKKDYIKSLKDLDKEKIYRRLLNRGYTVRPQEDIYD